MFVITRVLFFVLFSEERERKATRNSAVSQARKKFSRPPTLALIYFRVPPKKRTPNRRLCFMHLILLSLSSGGRSTVVPYTGVFVIIKRYHLCNGLSMQIHRKREPELCKRLPCKHFILPLLAREQKVCTCNFLNSIILRIPVAIIPLCCLPYTD